MARGCNSTIRDHDGTILSAILGEKGNAKPREHKNKADRTPQTHSTISAQDSKEVHYYKSVRLENANGSVKQNEQRRFRFLGGSEFPKKEEQAPQESDLPFAKGLPG